MVDIVHAFKSQRTQVFFLYANCVITYTPHAYSHLIVLMLLPHFVVAVVVLIESFKCAAGCFVVRVYVLHWDCYFSFFSLRSAVVVVSFYPNQRLAHVLHAKATANTHSKQPSVHSQTCISSSHSNAGKSCCYRCTLNTLFSVYTHTLRIPSPSAFSIPFGYTVWSCALCFVP